MGGRSVVCVHLAVSTVPVQLAVSTVPVQLAVQLMICVVYGWRVGEGNKQSKWTIRKESSTDCCEYQSR